LQANTVTLTGTLAAIEPLRHTPAGLPLVRFQLSHGSTQIEAGMRREVYCEVSGVGIGEIASRLSKLQAGAAVQVTGFLARKGRTGTQIVLHATDIANATTNQT
jgi:primosomal replication protein N